MARSRDTVPYRTSSRFRGLGSHLHSPPRPPPPPRPHPTTFQARKIRDEKAEIFRQAAMEKKNAAILVQCAVRQRQVRACVLLITVAEFVRMFFYQDMGVLFLSMSSIGGPCSCKPGYTGQHRELSCYKRSAVAKIIYSRYGVLKGVYYCTQRSTRFPSRLTPKCWCGSSRGYAQESGASTACTAQKPTSETGCPPHPRKATSRVENTRKTLLV